MDCVEAEIIPEEKVEDICMICSVFVHPDAKDQDKIYRYNMKLQN